MYTCELCNSVVQKRNKTKHNQTKKHKYYSNLILNRYVIKNVEVNKFKDEFNLYFFPPTRNFTFFKIHISLRLFEGKDALYKKIIVTNEFTYDIQSEHFSINTYEPANDFYIKFYQFFGVAVAKVLLK